MNSTSGREQVKALKAEIVSLEMEITDAVIASLFSSIENCWDHFPENNHAALLLQAIANVVHHVDILRTKANIRAQSLLRSLANAFEEVVGDKLGAEEKLEITAHEVKQVLDWQQECLEKLIEKQRTAGGPVVDGDGLRALKALFEKEMVKTKDLVESEFTSIKGLM
ncbi:MAG: hypothetical protein GQ559_00465 [Desulfobulbaceae bacterium]|nr:hypothetical protein [Desulfobulbaceae bacterium]